MSYFFRTLKPELKLAAKGLATVPGFSATVIATLAITLGALICVFNLNHLLLAKALPYPDAGQLIVLNHSVTSKGETTRGAQKFEGMQVWYKQQQVLAEFSL